MDIRPQPGFQERVLACSADILIAGGSAGCGKSWCSVVEPLRHIGIPGFGAIIFRRTFPELVGPGSIWEEATNIYPHLGGVARGEQRWMFPSGSSVIFGHLQHDQARLAHHGKAYALIIFEELCTFSEAQFWYLFSRNRSICGVRPYIRATCNPDPDSFVAKLIAWWINQKTGFPIFERSGVLRWFVRVGDTLDWGDSAEEVEARHPELPPGMARSLTFIPGRLDDNKILEQADPGYRARLLSLPRVDRERLLFGNWKVRAAAGMYFQRGYFPIIDEAPTMIRSVRFWDKAASEPTAAYPDPDWTAGVKVAKLEGGKYLIRHVARMRGTPGKVDAIMKAIASQDGKGVTIGVFQDPGQAGVVDLAHMRRLLDGYTIRSTRPTKDKVTLAGPFSSQCEGGNVLLLRGEWNDPYLDELENFPGKGKDDQVDGSSGAFNELQSSPLGHA